MKHQEVTLYATTKSYIIITDQKLSQKKIDFLKCQSLFEIY